MDVCVPAYFLSNCPASPQDTHQWSSSTSACSSLVTNSTWQGRSGARGNIRFEEGYKSTFTFKYRTKVSYKSVPVEVKKSSLATVKSKLKHLVLQNVPLFIICISGQSVWKLKGQEEYHQVLVLSLKNFHEPKQFTGGILKQKIHSVAVEKSPSSATSPSTAPPGSSTSSAPSASLSHAVRHPGRHPLILTMVQCHQTHLGRYKVSKPGKSIKRRNWVVLGGMLSCVTVTEGALEIQILMTVSVKKTV